MLILPGEPLPGVRELLILGKLPTLIVAPSAMVKFSVNRLIFPPSPDLTMALANKPLAPKGLLPNNSMERAVMFKLPPLPNPSVLTASCPPS